jgi:hypothetical protein
MSESIEQEIVEKGLTAPRVTPADIEANIDGEYYFTAGDAVSPEVTEEMVGRFLTWKLPSDFAPDGGISFVSPNRSESGFGPVGTNLLTAQQAKEMLYHAIGTPEIHRSITLLTFCVLVLRNGFTVTGESACASPENFDAELGRKIARQNAVNKIWPLMGYELRTQLAKD